MKDKEKQKRAELCKNCYFCETGVDKTISIDSKKNEQQSSSKADLCKNCYFCETGVDKAISVDDMKGKKQSSSKADLCRNCYFCETGVDKAISVDDMKGKKQAENMPFCWFLFPTNSCNLRCTYCYANNKPGQMTNETMHKSLDWLFKKQPHKNITCHFFGGEPTVCWDTIVDMVEIGNKMAESDGYKVAWSMTTNGTLLNKERLTWLQKRFRKGNPFLLSIDGRPETHDKYRILPGGKPSHHLIPVDLILKMFPNIEVRPTVMPDTAKDWFQDYRWLRNKGFKAIAIEPDFETDWTESQRLDYERMLMQLGQYYIYAHKAEKPIRMKFIDGVKGILESGRAASGRMCGVAYNCGAIDHRGMLYPCQRYASYNDPEKYAIGDVEAGWDEFRLFETQSLLRENVRGDISKGYNCATCGVRQFCFKGCNAANRKFNKTREISLPAYCDLIRIEVKVALSVLAELDILQIPKRK